MKMLLNISWQYNLTICYPS